MASDLAFLFAGQGAQTVGMGKDLYAEYPTVRALYDRADAAVPFELKRISFAGREEELRRTDVSQPAIVVHALAGLEALKAELGELPQVSFAAGLSLGEYSALCFAEVLSLEDTLRLVIARGEYMQACCEAEPSGMVSLLGLDADALGPAIEAGSALGVVGIANDNAPGQVVLSGAQAALEAATAKAKELGAKRAVPLNVAGAYHSQLMAPAGEKLARDLAAATWNLPRVPVIANVNAQPHTADPQEIQAALVQQVSSTVRFRESLELMFSLGAERCFEFGPGGVLKGLVRRVDRSKSCLSLDTVEQVRAAADTLRQEAR
ncbi:MAG: ACP S-malonyltransferase [Planctomycetes bacterium]|nr:ACP S-malonyltransferase [Planctomycetota bacterium]